ncbi:hypothetical protein EK21DRAFT_37116, partial [Setomelanomma holmii]
SIIGYLRYRPAPRPRNPTYHAADITVVVATTDIMSKTFHHVVTSILRHPIHQLIIPAAGLVAREQIATFQTIVQDQRLLVLYSNEVSRRKQTALAMPHVQTSLFITQDDHTYWPANPWFVQSIVAPFEDPSTGGVGTALVARHRQHSTSFSGFWNFLGMTYLAQRFQRHYLNDYLWLSKVPLNADDDKFHTRWLIEHGWKIKHQDGPDSTMMTELGEWPKFNEQVLRWTRTTWRQNPRQLMHKMAWTRHPYTMFTLVVWFLRMSIIQETAMFWLLYKSLAETSRLGYFRPATLFLMIWIIALKAIKILPHFKKHPQDFIYFPGYLVFGYW